MPPSYIELKDLPDPKNQYVAWIDIMGTKSFYDKTSKSPMLYILKLHSSAELATNGTQGFKYYPAADGFILTHDESAPLIEAVKKIFQTTALTVIETKKIEYRFMIRAGLAHGEINHGSDINTKKLQLSGDLKKSLVFGKALVAATEAEKGQPPFSVTIDSKTRISFIPQHPDHLEVSGPSYEYYAWFDDGFDKKESLKNTIIEYYTWISNHRYWVNDYDETNMKKHLFDFLVMLDSKR